MPLIVISFSAFSLNIFVNIPSFLTMLVITRQEKFTMLLSGRCTNSASHVGFGKFGVISGHPGINQLNGSSGAAQLLLIFQGGGLRQLKHDYLHNHVRPRLDQLVWITQTRVVPNYMVKAKSLEDTSRLGRARQMTAFQARFKEWQQLALRPIGSRPYKTSVRDWICTCPALKYNSFHICKHLVTVVPQPPPSFFAKIIRRRVPPFYRHPCLHERDTLDTPWIDPDDGSITDGDDHIYVGDKKLLADGSWRDLMGPSVVLGKRRSSIISDIGSSGLELDFSNSDAANLSENTGGESDAEDQVSTLQQAASEQLGKKRWE